MSGSFDSLGDRMKGYEGVTRGVLVKKTPVIIRVDGKAFHTLTSDMEKPVDKKFQECMWATAKYLCKNVQGVQLAYVQSDEISLLLVDYQSIESEGWFDYQIQKMCSVAAAYASVSFGEAFRRNFPTDPYLPMPVFDARVFNLPREEVVNYFIWRQQDATRNSISMLAQANFSHKELHGKSCDQMQEMLYQECNINWNDCPTTQKRGACVVKTREVCGGVMYSKDPAFQGAVVTRPKWNVDENIPVFTQDRQYVQKYVDQTQDD